jgi:uncharacterized protein (TIGR03083 family)
LQNLINVLDSLTPEEWELPTPCPGWSVHDLVAHILGDEVGQLSMGRDGFQPSLFTASNWDELVEGLNKLNEDWVVAMRRMSPQLLVDLLKLTGEQVNEYLESLDLHATGPVVSWASLNPSPMWLHVAREYTERWHHQQQIREAVGRPLLTTVEWFSPVLATFVHGLPHTYADVNAPEGTAIQVTISGASGGTWLVALTASGWALYADEVTEPTAHVTIDEIDAWKLFTKSIDKGIVEKRIVSVGDRDLGLKMLGTVSIIA